MVHVIVFQGVCTVMLFLRPLTARASRLPLADWGFGKLLAGPTAASAGWEGAALGGADDQRFPLCTVPLDFIQRIEWCL